MHANAIRLKMKLMPYSTVDGNNIQPKEMGEKIMQIIDQFALYNESK